MKARCIAIITFGGFLIAASAVNSKRLDAQESTRPVKVQIPPRTTLAGSWKFNHDESDDPLQEVRSAESERTANTDGYPGSGNVAGGYPGGNPGGYPGGNPGGYPGGNPGGAYPGGDPGRNPRGSVGGYPAGGGGLPRNTGQAIEDNPKMQPLIHPSGALTVDLKNPEVDMKDDHFYELTLYTDGRQLPKKSTDESHEQVLAHWNGSQLVSDEKSPLGGKMSRTFELSQDGRKLFETLHIDNRRFSPLVIHYVYDASSADVQSGPGTKSDADHPPVKKPSDSSPQ
ncbi:MAG: hypothetical protein ABSA57_10160 [Candidatus Acidiferrales bacterium]|jgi:hypothetical protein